MGRRLWCAGVAAVVVSSVFGQAGRDYDGYSIVRVSPTTVREMQVALTACEELWSERAGLGPFDVVANAEQLAVMRDAGLAPVTLVDDLGPQIREERAEIKRRALLEDDDWYSNYKELDQIEAYVADMAANFPQLVSTEIIGQSLEGRDIMAARITGPGDPSPRPAFLMNGCQHAREWVSPMTVTYIAEQLLNNYGTDPEVTLMMDRIEFLFVFVVNPDGYTYTWSNQRLWRKNKRRINNTLYGVDTNRNWDIAWGGAGSSGNPDNETYRGTAPFSEPETQVMRDFINANPNIAAHIDFHSFSQLILYPWGWEGAPPLPADDYQTFTSLSGEMSDTILSVHGQYYTPQPSIDLYAAAGVMSDWTYSQDILGWTIELRPNSNGGGGFQLPPDQILPTAEENWQAIKVVGRHLAIPLRITPDASNPAWLAPNTQTPIRFSITETTGELDAAFLYWRVGDTAAFRATPLVNVGDNTYEAALPGATCGGLVQFYVQARATNNDIVSYPAGADDEPITLNAYQEVASFLDDIETDTGWIVGAASDDATTGIWERADPQATNAQPGDDHTPDGSVCWVTDGDAGSGIGSFDVDGGATTLTSPRLDATGGADDPLAVVSYWRWYSNDQGSSPNADSMPIMISNDDGASWVELEDVADNAGAWVFRSFVVNDYVTPTDQVRLRFIARDEGQGSIVEAGVDDVAIEVFGCDGCAADVTGDDLVNTNDFFAFLALYQAGDSLADFTGDGDINTNDFFAFLAAYAQCD